MRKLLTILSLIVIPGYNYAQQENPVQPGSIAEQQLETLTEQQEGETEDDSYMQLLVQLKKNPINLNIADENELKDIRILTDVQIKNLVNYRKLLGSLVSIYELQAVPGWDLETIQKALPYVRIGSTVLLSTDVKQRLTAGDHSLLIRMQQILEKSNGFLRADSIANRYAGSPQKLLFRYKYVYKNLLQFGITGEKDSGEQFFKGSQKKGFDFYSFHLFARKLGKIKAVALGDFTVNLGQGLIHWQSLAFKKSADITAIKRQSDVLRPYNSAGEYNFLRGAGITISTKNIDVTAFASARTLDATYNNDTSQTNNDFVSTILNSGYHRTTSEVLKKNSITQTAAGGNLSYTKNRFHVGVNGVAFTFSVPLVRDAQLYNQYAIRGKNWYNYSVDYSYTFKNIHVYGEGALDKNSSKAFVGGVLAAIDPVVDISAVYRNIEKSYQSLYGNAFTESSFPTNENGLFTGISVKPNASTRIDAYADLFSFPWLRYRVSAPSKGSEYFIQITYKPNKQVELYSRFKNENKGINISGLNLSTSQVFVQPKHNWRTQISYIVSREVTLRSRTEVIWFKAYEKLRSQQGFLTYFDAHLKPFKKKISANVRLLYFQTEGFDSRLYAFENDVLYSFSIPQFIGTGFRYYINANAAITTKLSLWLRYSKTAYANTSSISSGLDKIEGNRKSEIKMQIMYTF